MRLAAILAATLLCAAALGCVHAGDPSSAADAAATAPEIAPTPPEPLPLASYSEGEAASPEPGEAPAEAGEPAAFDEYPNEQALDDSVPRHWPVDHEARNVISEYGNRSSGFHRGIDIKAPMGSPVIAAASGTVVESGYGRGYGQYVEIEHSPEFSTLYGHLKSRSVEKGQRVDWGDTIGLLGASGNASTHHVHFEVRWNGECADPAFFLPAWEFLPGFEERE